MVTLRLDSHMLSDFQQCAQRGRLAHVEGYRKPGDKPGLTRGTRWHQIMEFRAEFKRGKITLDDVVQKTIKYLQDDKVEMAEVMFYVKKLAEYESYWKDKEPKWKYIANEVGFSKVLWQNRDVRFLYDGKIDLLLEVGEDKAYVDHKTQHPGFSSARYDIFPYNNQFIGYCWATGYDKFLIDYTVWGAKVTDRTFRRQLYYVSRGIVKQWLHDTIKTYWKIYAQIKTSEYPLNRSACDGKYGICDYAEVCKFSDERSKLIKLESGFVIEPRWEPWV